MPRNPLTRTRLGQPNVRKGLKELSGGKKHQPFRTGRRRGVGVQTRIFPEPAADWKGTLPEWAIYWAHTTFKLKEGEDFYYIYGFGMTSETDTQIDFYEVDMNLGIEVQGIYWHYTFDGYKRQADIQRRAIIEALGLQLVFIDEDDALRDPIYYLKEAFAGRDHSIASRGI